MVDVNAMRHRTFSVSVVMILIVAIASTTQLASMTVSNGGDNIISNVYAKYSNSQAQSPVNECGEDGSSGINCVVSGPLIQADGSATATPIVSNAEGQGEQGPPRSQGPTASQLYYLSA